LRKSGFTEGENLTVTGRFSAPLDRADAIAAELVGAAPDAIATGGAALTRSLQRATQTIPILSFSDNLVAEKAVASLGHPGGNIAGISILASELDGKRQEILIEMLSGVRHITALSDPADRIRRVGAPHSTEPPTQCRSLRRVTLGPWPGAHLLSPEGRRSYRSHESASNAGPVCFGRMGSISPSLYRKTEH
jgi:hypothetical protein